MSHTRAVLLLLSDSFGSRPRLNNWCNKKLSPLRAAKHRLRGRSILPRASMFSVSTKTSDIIGSSTSFKCCPPRKKKAHSALHVKSLFWVYKILSKTWDTISYKVLDFYMLKGLVVIRLYKVYRPEGDYSWLWSHLQHWTEQYSGMLYGSAVVVGSTFWSAQ